MIPQSYNEANIIAKTAESEILSRLDIITLQPTRILDIGSKLGTSTIALHHRYPTAEIHGIEPSSLFFDHAKNEYPSLQWCNSSIETLPYADCSIDLIVANLSLSSASNLETIFTEWRRVLRPGGLLMFSHYGPDTLKELFPPHFPDMHDVGDALQRAGFMDPVMDIERITLIYRDPKKLLHELLVTGMINDQEKFLLEEKEKYPLTYEIMYGHTWGPEEEGVVKIPFARLRASLLKKTFPEE
jgi:malonyl-CoA O-methyltransferase